MTDTTKPRLCPMAISGNHECAYPYCACHERDDESLHAEVERIESKFEDSGLLPVARRVMEGPSVRDQVFEVIAEREKKRIDESMVAIAPAEGLKAATEDLILRYVCGFAMGKDNVLLLTKAKPEWQAGKLNGIGGKVEDTDASLRHAMEREFAEETGVYVRAYNWTLFHTERFGASGAAVDESNYGRNALYGANGMDSNGERINVEVYFFYARVGSAIMREACENTAQREEPCSVHAWRRVGEEDPRDDVQPPCMGNLPYLLRAAAHYWQNMVDSQEWKNACPYISRDICL